jgi:hypothetical protein
MSLHGNRHTLSPPKTRLSPTLTNVQFSLNFFDSHKEPSSSLFEKKLVIFFNKLLHYLRVGFQQMHIEMAESETNAPIAFKLPGLKPDICLKVFDQEYHADSILIKLHSAFFRTFLDSPDKIVSTDAAEANPPRGFQYEWATKVDEGGSWQLIAAPAIMQVCKSCRSSPASCVVDCVI